MIRIIGTNVARTTSKIVSTCPLSPCRNNHAQLLKELDLKRTQMAWESNKLSEAESKLYHSEQQNARKKEELTKLRIRLQEATDKLNQGVRVLVYTWDTL